MKPVILLLVLAVVGGCSYAPERDEATIPAGWSRASVFDCCSVAVPPGTVVAPMADQIDTQATKIEGPGLRGVLALVNEPGVERPPGSVVEVEAVERVAGRDFATVRLAVPDDKVRRFSSSGRLREQAPGHYLRGEVDCGEADCRNARALLASLRVTG